jgi:hypothetical protein
MSWKLCFFGNLEWSPEIARSSALYVATNQIKKYVSNEKNKILEIHCRLQGPKFPF